MVDRLFLPAIKFINMPVLLNKSNEVSFDFGLHFCLTLLHRCFVLGANLFVFLEHFPNLIRFLAKCILSEFAEV